MKTVFHSAIRMLNNVYSRSILVSSLIISGAYLVFFAYHPDFQLFPDKNKFSYEFYNDSASGGNSIIIDHIDNDSIIGLEFKLNEGILTPYIGINISPEKDRIINLSNFDQFYLEVESEEMESLGFYLFTENFINNKRIVVCFYENVKLKQGRNKYHTNINRLKIPDWWFAANNLLPDERIKPNLKQTLYCNIGTNYTSRHNTKCTLKIFSISFKRNFPRQVIYIAFLLFVEMLIIIIVSYFNNYLKNKGNILTISYKPIDIKDNGLHLSKNFVDFINQNFNDSDLSLEKVSKETGVHQKIITDYFNNTFGQNFRTYINNLRINESKRLLKATNFSIGEVAFKVGFNNQSHFNRVFKSIVGKSPSEFRVDNQ